MMTGVSVKSIQSLDQLRLALKRFKGEANERLLSLNQELIRKEQYLNDQINHWRHRMESYQDDVLEARKYLEDCRDDDDNNCSREEEILGNAKRNLTKAEIELEEFKKLAKNLEDVASDYRKQIRRLKEFMNNDLESGCLYLDSKITLLNEFVNIPVPLQQTAGIDRPVIAYESNSNKLSFAEKNQIMLTLPQPEGLPYSDNMKKYLVNLSHLDNNDFQVMSKYLKSKDHKPAIFNNGANAEKVFRRDFPNHFRREGGWNDEWDGVTLYYTESQSSIRGLPENAHRTIIARYGEDVLIHELAHQLHNLAWSETGPAGEAKRMKIRELYSNVTEGRIRPVSNYVDSVGEYFAYSTEWFFQHPAELNSRDPSMFEFLNTQVFEGMYHES